ncbi:AbrB/MazE/SpoVT family DNA-binding domain-containing protein [Alkalilimnicola ehrlichii]|uniref:AbrB/MazE/SpoVT family DNA-binding domain-containing protein n=1 Tax=Alkalilimnicola ehrlichii TaxID=351052 RepID=A0A3E0WJF0_9GAMM|nr:type II toxin-antitoxin system VapB family antitoxin [Alkalilimnicola ehrlichii]RFA26590.1 AbrB/MazE/SpoVT family DNA-binding domain-containing protein [Alkalilimnicola ehrlichii]RFA32908.1 AbrB/MazE/SpoVT family DNA-binding domain-containing protein [Alkalilimnicola ehrlichii]
MSELRTASLFRNGRNQAVRLPRDFTLDADQVYIERRGDEIVLRPKPRTWSDYFSKSPLLPEDFPDSIEDTPPQDRDAL